MALNAAVEAARAGSAGRGFSVVASEVGDVEQRSAEVARQILRVVDQSVDEIVENVRRVDALISEMSDTPSQQSKGRGHLRNSIAEIDRMTTTTPARFSNSLQPFRAPSPALTVWRKL